MTKIEYGRRIHCGCGCGKRLHQMVQYDNGRFHKRRFISGHNPSLGRPNRQPKAELKPTLFNITWAGGIYEGEGYVGNNKGSMVISIGQKRPWILHKLQQLFGGVINKKHATQYTWRCNGSRARGFALTIFAFLSPWRQEQIKQRL